MKISISNLSWKHSEDDDIAQILASYSVKGIEIAATKVWKDPISVPLSKISEYKKYWLKWGISIVATTSLLFTHPELTIFENSSTREKTKKYLFEMIKISSLLGATTMVFGSPKNRQTYNLSKKELIKISKDFFLSIASFAKNHNILFGIEPNPVYYGTNFINTTKEAIELVKLINHSNFRLNLDTGSIVMNNEDFEETIKKGLPLTCHFHISEPMLKQIGQGKVDHVSIAKILKALKYDKWVSVEMPLADNTNHKKIIIDALKFVTSIYD